MDNQKRVIQINPDFFKVETKTRKNRGGGGSRKKRGAGDGENGTEPSLEKKVNSKLLKKKLLQKLRENHKAETSTGGSGSDDEFYAPTSQESDFENSMRYFDNLKKNAPPSVGGGKQHGSQTDEYVNLQIPQELQTPGILTNITHQTPSTFKPLELSPAPYIENPLALPPPQYGCLKGGSLPTYRTLRSKQRFHAPAEHMYTPPSHWNYSNGGGENDDFQYYSPPPTENVYVPPPPPNNIKQQLRKHLYEKELEETPPEYFFEPEPTKHRKTIKRKYEVGKSKIHPKVSVLISNKTIRKRILNDTLKHSQVPIHEVKKFLQKKGLIKVGSAAPNNILRKMYENAMLMGGDIVNHNKETLLYNFLNETK